LLFVSGVQRDGLPQLVNDELCLLLCGTVVGDLDSKHKITNLVKFWSITVKGM